MGRWVARAVLAGLASLFGVFFGGGWGVPAQAASSVTLQASAETYVYSGATGSNFGAADPTLFSAGSYRGLLKFDTSGLLGTTISSVTLKVYSTVTLSSGGVAVHPEGDSWTESAVTWSNQPTWNTQTLATSSTPTSGVWISISLPVSSVNAGGITDLGLSYSAAGVIGRVAGRTGGYPPQLVITSGAAAAPTLTRAPYLTDPTTSSMLVNWATLSGGAPGTLTWGPAGGSCAESSAPASTSSFSVQSTAETMYSAKATGLQPGTTYCYQILVASTPLLSTPGTFHPLPIGTGQFTFDVFGDTGENASGQNPNQDALYKEMAQSGADFALSTGDIAYPGGTQDNYGDLQQAGPEISNVFGPTGWPIAGGAIPFMPVLGNHGRISAFLQNFPEPSNVVASNGIFQMVNYPGQDGATTASYPTDYFAFNVGQTRFYVLDADWTDSNIGNSTSYGQDYLNHWAAGSAELAWLQNDLATHPGGTKFALFHYPLHSDNATESTDTYLNGINSLEGLLSNAGVKFVFNGHAHMYQRNNPIMGIVSYVTGGGGATLEPTGGNGCSQTDAYSIGWSPTTGSGSKCGNAPVPTSASQVYHFLKVTVNGSTVTIAPTNALGQTFDVQTYNVGPTTTSLNAVAETYVYNGSTSTNYGAADPTLFSAGSYRALMKFDTSSLAGANIAGVTLKVYSTVTATNGGVAVHPEPDTWNESTVTWNNQPTWSTQVLATSATPTSGNWVSITLPVSAINPGGVTNLGLSYSVSGMIERIAGRTSANPPQLIVTTQ
jgi:Calcineurin-like phosphoesterase/Purple acid Phosphatase, N-terminal domain